MIPPNASRAVLDAHLSLCCYQQSAADCLLPADSLSGEVDIYHKSAAGHEIEEVAQETKLTT